MMREGSEAQCASLNRAFMGVRKLDLEAKQLTQTEAVLDEYPDNDPDKKINLFP